MVPQQQNAETKSKSHVYVQKPDGEEINVPATDPSEMAGKKDEELDQTAGHTPTTHSEEVRSGEDA